MDLRKYEKNWDKICKNKQDQKVISTIYAKNPQLRKSLIWKTRLKKKDEISCCQEYWKENKTVLKFSYFIFLVLVCIFIILFFVPVNFCFFISLLKLHHCVINLSLSLIKMGVKIAIRIILGQKLAKCSHMGHQHSLNMWGGVA